MHVITLGGTPPHTVTKVQIFFYSNNYWQAHSLVTTFNLVSECQNKTQYHRTRLQIHTVQKHYRYNGGVLARQTSTFNFQNISVRKEVLVSAWTQTSCKFIIPSKSTTQRSAAIFTMWFHKKKKKDNVQAALNLKEHYTASTLVLYDSVVDAFYKSLKSTVFSHKHTSKTC